MEEILCHFEIGNMRYLTAPMLKKVVQNILHPLNPGRPAIIKQQRGAWTCSFGAEVGIVGSHRIS